MQLSTTATRAIGQLERVTLLGNVGQRHAEDVAWERIDTWASAIVALRMSAWQSLRLDIRNSYTSRLAVLAPSRFELWNAVADLASPAINRLVETALHKVPSELAEHRTLVRDSMYWDLLNLTIECEFSDAIPTQFYTGLGFFYLQGKLPCGWTGGVPPAGRPLVF